MSKGSSALSADVETTDPIGVVEVEKAGRRAMGRRVNARETQMMEGCRHLV